MSGAAINSGQWHPCEQKRIFRVAQPRRRSPTALRPNARNHPCCILTASVRAGTRDRGGRTTFAPGESRRSGATCPWPHRVVCGPAACTECFLALITQPPRPPPPCPRYPALPPLGSTHIPIDWRGDLSLGGSRTNAGSTHSELIFTRKVVQMFARTSTQSPGTSTN